MIKFHDILDTNKVADQIADGYISVRHHTKGDLRIYNYTHKCQYDWKWTPETIACRGLIVDTGNNVVARPWPKFFTVSQYQDLRNNVHHLYGVKYKEMYEGPGHVTEKMDGCMGILYWVGGEPAIATRGSFTSHQAELATQIFRERYSQAWLANVGFDINRTYIFECILPEYRIVVDYHGLRDIVLIGCVNNNTGEDESIDWIRPLVGMPPVVEEHKCFARFEDVLASEERDNAEGYVVYFKDTGIRAKVKHQDYLDLHRIMTGCTKRTIWEYMRAGLPLDDLIARVPDEMYDWIIRTRDDLQNTFNVIKEAAVFTAEEFMNRGMSRKEQAVEIQKFKNPGLIWAVIDGKIDQMNDKIWRMIKPEAETPWTNSLEGETK